MKSRLIIYFLIPFGLILAFLFQPSSILYAQDAIVPIDDLEKELSSIESKVLELELNIDNMLESLVDPKITSISIFFSSGQITGRVPISVDMHIDGKKISSRTFSEIDRLVLLRGGTIEVYGGIIEPKSHTLAISCLLSSTDKSDFEQSTGKGTFKFEPRRASANFFEISLTEKSSRKGDQIKLNARHWSREP